MPPSSQMHGTGITVIIMLKCLPTNSGRLFGVMLARKIANVRQTKQMRQNAIYKYYIEHRHVNNNRSGWEKAAFEKFGVNINY